jgi:hypothetical protein
MQTILVDDSRVNQASLIKSLTMKPNKVNGYYEEAYPPFPTSATRGLRKNILFQFYRFIVLNLKMMRIIVGGHS